MSKNPYLDELEELQSAHAVASNMARMLRIVHGDYKRAMTLVNAHMGIIGKRIAEIKSGTDSIVTDHAVVRYLQRYANMDIEKIKERIAELPEDEKIVIANNVITVGKDINKSKESQDDETKTRNNIFS